MRIFRSTFPVMLVPVLFLSAALCCQADAIVTHNVSPGATSWPGNPLISTVANPASQATIGESFNAVGGGTGTGAGTNLTLHLFDVGIQTAPNPSPYAPGTDLFNSGNGLSITYTPQTMGVLQHDSKGAIR